MRCLLDTHTFIWFIEKNSILSKTADAIIKNSTNEIYVSIVSLWEIAVKVSLGKLSLPSPFDKFIEKERRFAKIKMLPFGVKHTKTYANLPYIIGANQKQHTDPFDRMLISIAKTENISIISADQNFPFYTGLKVIW